MTFKANISGPLDGHPALDKDGFATLTITQARAISYPDKMGGHFPTFTVDFGVATQGKDGPPILAKAFLKPGKPDLANFYQLTGLGPDQGGWPSPDQVKAVIGKRLKGVISQTPKGWKVEGDSLKPFLEIIPDLKPPETSLHVGFKATPKMRDFIDSQVEQRGDSATISSYLRELVERDMATTTLESYL